MRAAIFAGLIALMGAPAIAAAPPVPKPSAPAMRSTPSLTADWYSAFPHPETVIKGVEGSFDLHTRVKQASTLHVLREGLLALASENPPADEAGRAAVARRSDAYSVTANTLRTIAVGDSNLKKRLFASKNSSYRRDPAFIVEVAKGALPPDVARRMIVALHAESALTGGKVAAEVKPASEPSATPTPVAEPGIGDFLWAIVWSPLGLIVLVGAGVFVWLSNRKGEGGRTLSDNYGSARYADVRRSIEPKQAGAGVFLGKSSHPELSADDKAAPVFTTPESHTLILARSGTGKGTRVIVPTLLRYPDSMIVIDPKGENAAITARTRSIDLAQTVHVLNPWNELAADFAARGIPRSATYNPLDILDRNDPNASAIAQGLAEAICGAGEGKDAIWRESAAQLLTAVFLWLADQPGEQKTLARARHIVTRSRGELDKFFLPQMAASTAFGGAVSELASPFIGMAEETFSGVLFNLAAATRFISDEQIKKATASSTFQMRDLIDRRTTVYIVFPSDRMGAASTWLRLILAAATHAFRRTKRGKDSPRCMFLIDEFPALGKVASMPRDIAEMRGYGLDFTLVVQGLDQLRDHYGEAHRTIINNCGFQWYCNISDLETAKYLSTALGKKTVSTASTSEGLSGGGASASTSYGETGRELLQPDEILALGRDVAIAIQPQARPLYLRPIDYWNLPAAFSHLAGDGMQGYFTPQIRYDDNPYVRMEQEQADRRKQKSQQKQQQKAARAQDGMTRIKALTILGLKDGATADEIRTAYGHLIKKVHPDTGGTTFFTQQLNEARDFLIGAK